MSGMCVVYKVSWCEGGKIVVSGVSLAQVYVYVMGSSNNL